MGAISKTVWQRRGNYPRDPPLQYEAVGQYVAWSIKPRQCLPSTNLIHRAIPAVAENFEWQEVF